MKKEYIHEVAEAFRRSPSVTPGILTDADLRHLPAVVRKYIYYTGLVGKEKILNFRVRCEGRIRSKPDSSWMNLVSEQYNFFDRPTRIFYITATKMGIPAAGLHLYKDEKASMVIKLAGLFKIADARGPEMNQGETVTLFNDMCFLAPGTLISKNIEWESVDPLIVKARYRNGSLSISAALYFNETGELVNFISNDRFETTDGKTYLNNPWSTPIGDYKNFKGIRLATFAKTIFHRPDSEFCYGEFHIKDIEYNCEGICL